MVKHTVILEFRYIFFNFVLTFMNCILSERDSLWDGQTLPEWENRTHRLKLENKHKVRYGITCDIIISRAKKAVKQFWSTKRDIKSELKRTWVTDEMLTTYDDDDPFVFDDDSSIEM